MPRSLRWYLQCVVKAEKKLLVLTDPGFFKIFTAAAAGKVLPDTGILLCELSAELSARIAIVHQAAREEIGKRL